MGVMQKVNPFKSTSQVKVNVSLQPLARVIHSIWTNRTFTWARSVRLTKVLLCIKHIEVLFISWISLSPLGGAKVNSLKNIYERFGQTVQTRNNIFRRRREWWVTSNDGVTVILRQIGTDRFHTMTSNAFKLEWFRPLCSLGPVESPCQLSLCPLLRPPSAKLHPQSHRSEDPPQTPHRSLAVFTPGAFFPFPLILLRNVLLIPAFQFLFISGELWTENYHIRVDKYLFILFFKMCTIFVSLCDWEWQVR